MKYEVIIYWSAEDKGFMAEVAELAGGGAGEATKAKALAAAGRVAKLEGACAEASLDLICRALFALGVTNREMGRVIGAREAA